MDGQSPSDEQDLILSHALRRRWLQVAIPTMILAGMAGVYGSSRPVTYTSSAKVLLSPLPGNALSPETGSIASQVTVAMDSEAGLVNSPAVLKIMNTKRDVHIAAKASEIQVSVPTNTEIIVIKFSAPTATAAQDGANATADAFLQYRGEQASATVAAQLANLTRQAQDIQTNLRRAARRLAGSSPPTSARSQVSLYSIQLAVLQQTIGQLQGAPTDPGLVATPAGDPKSAKGVITLLYSLVAALLGFGISVIVVIFRARSDRLVRAATATAIRGRPVLTVLPARVLSPTAADNGSAAARNAYLQVRTAVLALPRVRSVAISQLSARWPDLEVAAHLGLSIRDAGFEVVVVDARLDGPSPSWQGAEAQPSLRAVLDSGSFGDLPLASRNGVYVVPADKDSPQLRESLAGPRFPSLLRNLQNRADYVLIAAPPASTSAGVAVALAADALILTVVDGITTRAQVHEVLDRADRLNIAVIGLIVTPSPGRDRFNRRAKSTAGRSAGTDLIGGSSGNSRSGAARPIGDQVPTGSGWGT